MGNKRMVLLIYGEPTVQLNMKVPESKYNEVKDAFNEVLKRYENPMVIESGVTMSDKLGVKRSWKDVVSGLNSGVQKKVEPLVEVDVPIVESRESIISRMKEIAAGNPVSSGVFLPKKRSLDEMYEFEVVSSLPDLEDRVAVDVKGISMYSRYDLGIYYVVWERRNLKFTNESEFRRFLKDNGIK